MKPWMLPWLLPLGMIGAVVFVVVTGRYAALLALHFPPADVNVDDLNEFDTPAQRRLIYEEAYAFQLGLLARRRFARQCARSRSVRRD